MKDTRNPLITSIYPDALTLTLLAGVGLRIWHLFSVGFSVPFNLGGLFYQMSVEIINHHFSLPVWIPYYFKGGLPFAYPPLPLYIQALLIKGFHPKGFLTENLLPPLFSILSLFFFYFLARKVFSEKWRVLAAVLIFSSLPAAFTEQIRYPGIDSLRVCLVVGKRKAALVEVDLSGCGIRSLYSQQPGFNLRKHPYQPSLPVHHALFLD